MEKEIFLWSLAALLVVIGLAGIVLPAIPGTILVFGGLLLASGIDHFDRVGWPTLVFLGFLTVLSFIIDYVASAYGAKQSGASRQAVIGAVIGLILGMFMGIPGIIFGPFFGAMIGEFMVNRDIQRAGRAGFGAWLGLVIAMAGKIAIAFTMIGTFIIVYIAGK